MESQERQARLIKNLGELHFETHQPAGIKIAHLDRLSRVPAVEELSQT